MNANITTAAVLCQDYGSSTTECVSRDLLDDFREIDLADLKQEPHDVCGILCLVLVYYDKEFLQITSNTLSVFGTILLTILFSIFYLLRSE